MAEKDVSISDDIYSFSSLANFRIKAKSNKDVYKRQRLDLIVKEVKR